MSKVIERFVINEDFLGDACPLCCSVRVVALTRLYLVGSKPTETDMDLIDFIENLDQT